MLKTLKFKGNPEDFFFSSDLHIGQSCSSWENPLWKMRGYDSVESHKEGVVKSWNEHCGAQSICFHLGDMVFEDPYGEKFMDLVYSLNFKELYCYLGNHSSGQSVIYKRRLENLYPDVAAAGLEVYPLEMELIEGKKIIFLPQYADIQINGTFIACCHYPIVSHNRLGKSSWSLGGHSHNKCELTNKDSGRGKRLDVGWDGWAKPVSLAEIKEHLKDRDIDSPDHHDSNCGI
jgi:calcineurin-like phosphoesterase family protein